MEKEKNNVIDNFIGDHRFLSNFDNVPVIYKNILFENNEAAFQAMKSFVSEEELKELCKDFRNVVEMSKKFIHHKKFIFTDDTLLKKARNILLGVVNMEDIKEIFLITKYLEFSDLTPNLAKSKGRKIPLRHDWDSIRDEFMYEICLAKFTQNKKLRKSLIETGADTYLVEGNTWNDTYWGVCNGVGENHLGQILIRVRKELS